MEKNTRDHIKLDPFALATYFQLYPLKKLEGKGTEGNINLEGIRKSF